MMKLPTQAECLVPYPQAEVFERVVHIDVPAVFRGRGLIAAVREVHQSGGDWREVGERRQVVLSDGSSLWEEITAYQQPQRFDYVLGDLRGALAFLVSSIEGEWHYQALGPQQTRILWRYDFIVRRTWVYPLAWLFVRWLWMPYMRQVMRDIQTYLAQHAMPVHADSMGP